MNAPGKTMLKVVSILYIIFGACCALLMLLSLAFGPVLASFVGSLFGSIGGAMGGMFGAVFGTIIFFFFLIPAAVDLTIGIIGLKQCGDPSRALFFIISGFILAGLSLIGMGAFSVFGLLGLPMPILYIVGGFMNKNAA